MKIIAEKTKEIVRKIRCNHDWIITKADGYEEYLCYKCGKLKSKNVRFKQKG